MEDKDVTEYYSRQHFLDEFHRHELEERPKFCREKMHKDCDHCDSSWCAIHRKYGVEYLKKTLDQVEKKE